MENQGNQQENTENELEESFKKQEKDYLEKAKEIGTRNKEIINCIFFKEVKGKLSDRELTGKLLVAYVRDPHPTTAIRAMDYLLKGEQFQAGLSMLPAVYLESESSPELKHYKYQAGICLALAKELDIVAADVKKS